jgi:hypothetical protein
LPAARRKSHARFVAIGHDICPPQNNDLFETLGYFPEVEPHSGGIVASRTPIADRKEVGRASRRTIRHTPIAESAQSLQAVNPVQAVTRRRQIADLGYALDSDCTDPHASSGTRCVCASVPWNRTMANFPGRSDRRRRVLNEEVFSASRSHLALRAEPQEKADARYGEAALVKNHPHVSDFVPRRLRSMAVVVVAGVVATGLVAGLHVLEASFASNAELSAAAPQILQASDSVVAWSGCVLLLATGLICGLIHAVRRHRLDDVRGRYRIWKWAGAACVLASADCVIGFHTLLAESASYAMGWTALRDGAVWWLVLIVPAAWIGLRAFIDARENGAAMGLLGLSAISYGTAMISYLGWVPSLEAPNDSLASSAGGMFGHWLLFAGTLAYARYVVLDAEGLIENSRQSENDRASDNNSPVEGAAKPTTADTSRTAPTTTLRIADPGSTSPRSSTAAKPSAKVNEWVDGSRRERERYDDDEDEEEVADDRKFNKSERKQQRKLKARNRAA